MTSISEVNTTLTSTSPRVSELRRFSRVFLSRKIVAAGMVIIVLTIITAIFAPLIAPYSPYKTNLAPPVSTPSKAHLLGTDSLGRDILSRIIYGSRTSLIIGIVAITASAFVGMSLGMLAGYFGRWTFIIIMRIMDAMMSFPLILLALLFVAIFGSGLKNVIIALGVGLVPMYTRMMCGQVLSVKQSDYILAARSMGCSHIRIMLSHILRNTFPALIVQITMMMGACILAEAALSYLGLGIAPPQAAWGAMVYDGYKYLLANPVLSIAPGLAIMLVVFSFNMIGDGLRDALDPKLRGLL